MTTNITPYKRPASVIAKRSFSKGSRYLIALVLIAFAVIPALWVISASLNPAKSLASDTFIPRNPDLSNYTQLLLDTNFPYVKWLLNSLKIAFITSLATVFITATTGYALSRFRFRGRTDLMSVVLVINIFPSILAMVALYSMMQQFGTFIPAFGFDSHGGLIMVYIAGQMGINSLMVKAYIDAIPKELDEAAWMEGASYFQTFTHVILPMITPIIITVALLSFIASYGDFIIARVLLKTSDKLTVMVGLFLFRSDRFDVDYGKITAGAVLAALPIIMLYIPLQKYVISGLTAGAVKQ
ncbi:MAG: sugar ABC transporter permease [Anaerolineaceae bacterium]|nr:sugar ABC transporter permease [Anaerolineaceae bacterium]